MSEAYSMVEVDRADRSKSSVSGTTHVNLVEQLGCEEMRPNVWYLAPGDAVSYHRQTEQEELYYVIDGPGRIRIGQTADVMDVPTGTAIRIPAETPRQILNDTDRNHVWLVVGAPPVEDDGQPIRDDST